MQKDINLIRIKKSATKPPFTNLKCTSQLFATKKQNKLSYKSKLKAKVSRKELCYPLNKPIYVLFRG